MIYKMWNNTGSCWYTLGEFNNKTSVLFDYDDTLCARFTSSPKENVVSILQKLSLTRNIVIFTNQKGISTGKTSHSEIRDLIDNFQKEVQISFSVFYSTEDDFYRKPMTGMYELMKDVCGISDIEYYCGDAGGRKGDFSVSDLYFANNCGVVYRTPEEVFGKPELPVVLDNKNLASLELYKDDEWSNGVLVNKRIIFDALVCDSSLIGNIVENLESSFDKKKRNLIIMVGSQGSGKSTLSELLSKRYNLGIINGDILKTKANMKKR